VRPSDSYCLDAFAWLAWLQDEPGARTVEQYLQAAERRECRCFTSIINLGEVYYRLGRLGKPDDAAAFWRDATKRVLPVTVVDATRRRVRRAADLKTKYAIAYADAFAASTATEFRSRLITGDPELKLLVDDGLVEAVWLPQRT
jgi:uncharacterized protein